MVKFIDKIKIILEQWRNELSNKNNFIYEKVCLPKFILNYNNLIETIL